MFTLLTSDSVLFWLVGGICLALVTVGYCRTEIINITSRIGNLVYNGTYCDFRQINVFFFIYIVKPIHDRVRRICQASIYSFVHPIPELWACTIVLCRYVIYRFPDPPPRHWSAKYNIILFKASGISTISSSWKHF